MKKIFKILLIFAVLFSLNSCGKKISNFFPNRPNTAGVRIDDSMSVEFRQGWEDGCEVGMSAGTNTFYKMFYSSNAADGYKMSSSSDYKSAWGNAFWYCYRFDHIKTKSSIWGSVFKGI